VVANLALALERFVADLLSGPFRDDPSIDGARPGRRPD
jgi:hypothetical protein